MSFYADLYEQPETEEQAFARIARAVQSIWNRKPWAGKVHDDASQVKLITALQQKYVCPDGSVRSQAHRQAHILLAAASESRGLQELH